MPYKVAGGLFAERAINLLKEFYAAGNPNGKSLTAKAELDTLTTFIQKSRAHQLECVVGERPCFMGQTAISHLFSSVHFIAPLSAI